MATLSDCRFAALRNGGFTGATSDMLLQWLQDNGATSNSIPDAWRQFLDAQLGGSATGHRNDDWYAYLDSIAPAEIGRQLNDLEHWFWCVNQGGVTPGPGDLYVNYSRDASFPGDAPEIYGEFATYHTLQNDFSIKLTRVYDSGQAINGLVGSFNPGTINIEEINGLNIGFRDAVGTVEAWADPLTPLNLATGDQYDLELRRIGTDYFLLINNVQYGPSLPGTDVDTKVDYIGVGQSEFITFAGAVYNLVLVSDLNGTPTTWNYPLTDTADNDATESYDTSGNAGPVLEWNSNELEQNWVKITPGLDQSLFYPGYWSTDGLWTTDFQWPA